MLNTYLILLAILVISFFLANWFRLKNKYFGSDSFFHFMAAEHIKKNKFRLYKNIKTYTIPNPPDYPPLLHYILALLPSKKLVQYGRFIGVLFDFISKILVFFIALQITNNEVIALISVVAYALVNTISMDQHEASSHLLGSMLFNVLLILLFMYLETNNMMYIFAGVIPILLGFNSIKFFNQVLILTLPFLTIWYKDINILLPFIIGWIFMFIFIRERFIRTIKTMASTIKIWFSLRKKSHPGKRGYSKLAVYFYYYYLIGLVDLLVIAYVLFLKVSLPKSLMFFFVIMVWIRMLTFLVYHIKWFNCIGEAHRYFAYSALPSSICLAYIVVTYYENTSIILSAIAVALVAIVSLIKWQMEYKKNEIASPSKKIIESLRKLEKYDIKNMLVLPFQWSRNVSFLTKKKTFVTLSQRYFHVIKDITWELKDINEIIKENNITHVLIHPKFTSKFDIKNADKIFSDDGLILYKIKGKYKGQKKYEPAL